MCIHAQIYAVSRLDIKACNWLTKLRACCYLKPSSEFQTINHVNGALELDAQHDVSKCSQQVSRSLHQMPVHTCSNIQDIIYNSSSAVDESELAQGHLGDDRARACIQGEQAGGFCGLKGIPCAVQHVACNRERPLQHRRDRWYYQEYVLARAWVRASARLCMHEYMRAGDSQCMRICTGDTLGACHPGARLSAR